MTERADELAADDEGTIHEGSLTPGGNVIGPKAWALIVSLNQYDDFMGTVLDVVDEAAQPPVAPTPLPDEGLRRDVEAVFALRRRMYVRLPEEGADSIDAAIGDALNDAEQGVLAALRVHPADSEGEGLDVERLAITAAARLEQEISSLQTQLTRCSEAVGELDEERLAAAFVSVQPGVYGADWPRDDPDDFQFVNPRDHAAAIAAAYLAATPSSSPPETAEKETP